MAVRFKQSAIQNVSSTSYKDNSLDDYVQDYVEGWISENIGSGAFKEVTNEDIKKYLANPNTYYNEIANLIKYQQIANGNMYQLHTILTGLPSLNYKLNCFDVDKATKDKDLNTLNKGLSKIRYKKLAREVMSQSHSDGTTVSIWLGNKENMYLHVFSNLSYIFPAFRRKGEWVCYVDMEWLSNMEESERIYIYEELSPYITEADYNNYLRDESTYKYKELPTDRTHVSRFNTMSRNQRLGIPTGTQLLNDINHKETLKALEKSISDKIINTIPVLTIGDDNTPNEKIPKKLRRAIGDSVVKVLRNSFTNGKIGMITLPEYSKIEWKKADGLDALDDKKYTSINSDISTDMGISTALTNGTGNGSTAKYNLDCIYRRIGVYLEEIDGLFQKYCNLMLGASAKNYLFELEKETPLTKKEQLDALTKLHTEGFSVKSVVDMIPSIDYKSYIDQSINEHKSGMYDIITPPKTSSTLSASDVESGAPKNEDPDSEETIIAQDKDIGGDE